MIFIFLVNNCQGKLANFYRDLEIKHESLVKALISDMPLEFIGYQKNNNHSNHTQIPSHPLLKEWLSNKQDFISSIAISQ